MKIRHSTPEDAPSIAPLLSLLGYPTSPDALTERLERAGAGDATWVAMDERTATAVGFAAGHCFAPFELDGPVSELPALVVSSGVRRAGVGRVLVSAFEAWSTDLGCLRMTVATSIRRTDAHKFYEALGYEQLSRKYEKNF